MNHTPEPWKVYEYKRPYKSGDKEREHIERSIYTAYDHPQLRGPYPVVCASVGLGMDAGKPLHMVSLKEEDARRIVVCVNACKGISTDNLESILMLGDTLRGRFESRLPAESERDRLLNAAKSVIRNALDQIDVHPCDENNDEVKSHGLSPENRNLYLTIQSIEVTA